MISEYENLIQRTILDLMLRIDEAVVAHHQATGHQSIIVYDGYRCVDCDTQFRGSLRVVGDE